MRRTPDKPDVLARLIARDAQLWAVYDDDKAIAAIVTHLLRHARVAYTRRHCVKLFYSLSVNHPFHKRF